MVSWITFSETAILADIALSAGRLTGWMLFSVLFNEIGAPVENGVRGVVTEIEKERPIPVPRDEINSFQIEPIRQVLVLSETIFLKIDPSYWLRAEDVGPGVCPIPNGLDFASHTPVKTMILRSQFDLRSVIFVASKMPLADHSG